MVDGHRRKLSTGEWTPLGPPNAAGKPTQGEPSDRVCRRRDEIMVAWRDGELGWAKKTTPRVEQWWQTYEASHLQQQSEGTQEVYTLAYGRLDQKFLRKALADVTRTDCVFQLNAWRRRDDYAVSTIETTYVIIRGIFEAARRDHLIERNPWDDIEVERPKPRHRITTPQEDAELLGALSPYHGRWYRILLWTGLRISELTGLTPSRIHWQAELLTVRGKGSKRHRGGKWRDVPMMPEVAELLREQIAERGIGRKPQTKLWTEVTETFDGQLRRRCKDLGIPLVTPHTCRHTFATRFMEAGGDIYYLSQILGHSSVAVTEKMYVHVSKQSVVEAMRRVWQVLAPPPPVASTPATASIHALASKCLNHQDLNSGATPSSLMRMIPSGNPTSISISGNGVAKRRGVSPNRAKTLSTPLR